MAEQLVKSPLELIDLTIKVLPYLGAVALMVYVLFRTNAMFYVVYRWHQLLGAAKDFSSKSAQRVWADHEDLQRFNLWFGLQLRTSKHMAKLLSWLYRHELTIEDLCRARRYFDANELTFKIPSKRRRLTVRSLMVLGMAFLFFAAYVLTQTQYALLTVKKTQTTFWVQPDEAFNGSGRWLAWAGSAPWKVDNAYCLFADEMEPFKEQWDKDVVCNLVLGNYNQKIEAVIGEQWAIGMVGFCAAFACLFFLLFIMDREINARALEKEVAQAAVNMR
ncbi:hypothetical protein ALQ50_03087 [Pseudomonas coronafaciens pv. coronafaciens]|uniref:DUF6216 family protein n=1 Tax=Pseudomonas coronafaciens TaxID=53409 RepID=UPI000EFEA628|nr:DUF6216 family protein [Pseudomonas coronafaciens]RMN90148.1 hypothetical protein ALQ50_03087 [Pseudomonas coronafaciens pv. coronafaciens]